MKMRYFRIAKILSTKSDNDKHKLGAVLVSKSRIISVGFNRNKTHTKAPHSFKHLHAESDCIISCEKEDLRGTIMYVYRETKSGATALARPCPSCLRMLKEKGVKKVFYSTYQGYLGEDL